MRTLAFAASYYRVPAGFPFEGRFVGGGSCRSCCSWAGRNTFQQPVHHWHLSNSNCGPFLRLTVFNSLAGFERTRHLNSGIQCAFPIPENHRKPLSDLAVWAVVRAPARHNNLAGSASCSGGTARLCVDTRNAPAGRIRARLRHRRNRKPKSRPAGSRVRDRR